MVFLLLANLGVFSYYFILDPAAADLPYAKYVDHNQTLVFAVLEKDQLYDKIKPWSAILGGNFSFFGWFIGQADDYLKQANLDYERDISPLFRKKAALVIYQNQENPNSFPLIIFLEKKAASAQINRVLKQLEDPFKKEFYQADELYRQNNIVSLKSIKYNSLIYYYTQIKNYFIISSSKEHLQNTIDLMIDSAI